MGKCREVPEVLASRSKPQDFVLHTVGPAHSRKSTQTFTVTPPPTAPAA
jgi:hypothetical protein